MKLNGFADQNYFGINLEGATNLMVCQTEILVRALNFYIQRSRNHYYKKIQLRNTLI